MTLGPSTRKKQIESIIRGKRYILNEGNRYRDNKTKRWKKVDKTNVKGYYLKNFTNAGTVNSINKNKRVYIDVDLRNGKVQHVYDADGITRLLVNGNYIAKSPLTRRNFKLENVKPF